jgi:hypothetical protein
VLSRFHHGAALSRAQPRGAARMLKLTDDELTHMDRDEPNFAKVSKQAAV